jgi:hypothetical protein
MTTSTLMHLVHQARTMLGSVACQDGRHLWVSEGGRACPHDIDDNCGQAVYRCHVCGDQDYGEPGGPGHADCEQHCKNRVERAIAIAKSQVDPLGYGWQMQRGTLNRIQRHKTLLRHLRRQPKPRLP